MTFLQAHRRWAIRVFPAAALIGAAGATHPAAATALIDHAASLVTCATTTACVSGVNTTTGSGVAGRGSSGVGTSGTSSTNSGVLGVSTLGTGVVAESVKGEEGLYGYTLGSGDGVVGAAASGVAVDGLTTSGFGLYGTASEGGIGAGGQSRAGIGVYADSYSGTGLKAYSGTGTAVRADINGPGFSVIGLSDNNLGAGADFEGGRFGIIGRAQSYGFPLVLTNSSYQNVFYVASAGDTHMLGDAYVSGDLYLHGSYKTFARTVGGGTVNAFTAKSTEPTVEDTGTATLSVGSAAVTLDPAFAATIDATIPYHVFLTPNGDTRGLFVASKTTRGFIVRETQGGRSTLTFDYRIVATSAGQARQRISFVKDSSLAPVAPVPPAATDRTVHVPKTPAIVLPVLGKL